MQISASDGPYRKSAFLKALTCAGRVHREASILRGDGGKGFALGHSRVSRLGLEELH